MCKYLPTHNFKWNQDKWTEEQILNISDEANKGFKFECDIEIPEDKHTYFNNYVPCPESIKIKKSNLNQWQQANYKESNIRKLCCSFDTKLNYVVDYRYLKLCIQLGCKVLKIHRVLEYEQSPFLKGYIMKNTELRTKKQLTFVKTFLN